MHPIEHFCCQSPGCPDHGVRGKGNLSFRGWSGRGKRIRMVYCCTCGAHFSELKGTILAHARLPHDKALAVLEHIRQGCGTRATSRLVGVGKDTVTRYVRMGGAHAEKLHDELVAFSPDDPGDAAR
jgi:transposase-like protein